MCTKDEVRQVIHEEVFDPTEDGRSRLDKHIDDKFNQLFWRMMRWIGIPVLGLVAAWVNIQTQVNNNTEELRTGGRYTQEEHDLYAQEIDRRFDENAEARGAMQESINTQLQDIKDDVRDIRKAVIGY